MDELIKVDNNNVKTIDSREVAEMLEKEHKYILRDIEGTEKVVGIIPTLESANLHYQDYFIESTYKAGTREYKCYLCTKMGCELLGNKQQGEKGILFTAKYVKRFNEMEEQIKSSVPQISREDQLALAVYHGGMGAIEATKELTELKVKAATAPLKKKIEDDKPLVEFGKQVGVSDDSIDIGAFSKIIRKENIQLGRNDLFKWLREQKYLRGLECENKSIKPYWYNEPYQKYMDMGIFETKEYVIRPTYNSELKIKTLITGKGQLYLVKKLNEYYSKEMNLKIAN